MNFTDGIPRYCVRPKDDHNGDNNYITTARIMSRSLRQPAGTGAELSVLSHRLPAVYGQDIYILLNILSFTFIIMLLSYDILGYEGILLYGLCGVIRVDMERKKKENKKPYLVWQNYSIYLYYLWLLY